MKKIILGIIVAFLSLSNAYAIAISPEEPIYCTQEAKLCSDGKTWVGRTGPNCEFSACPYYNKYEKIDNILNKFFYKVEQKYPDYENRRYYLEVIIEKFQALAHDKPKYKSLIDYVIDKIDKRIEKYSDEELKNVIDLLN